jgi:hypothetical protein
LPYLYLFLIQQSKKANRVLKPTKFVNKSLQVSRSSQRSPKKVVLGGKEKEWPTPAARQGPTPKESFGIIEVETSKDCSTERCFPLGVSLDKTTKGRILIDR